VTLPPSYYILDISLLNVLNHGDNVIEQQYFAANPSHGRWLNWPIVGNLADASKVPKTLRRELARTLGDWQIDRLVERIPTIRKFIEKNGVSPAGVPLVIYVHCEAGEDRTGEVSGSYMMLNHNWTYTKALAWDNSIEKRDIHDASRIGLLWFCYYLLYSGKQTWQDCQ
jgi:hypothetical protein